MNTKPKFVIVCPRQQNGGTIVLHKLCFILQELGYDTRIFYSPCFNGDKRNTFLHYIFKYIKFLIHDTKKLILAKLFPFFFKNHSRYKSFFIFL